MTCKTNWWVIQSSIYISLSLLIFSPFFFFFILIDISQLKGTKSCLQTSQCNRSIKSGHLQVTPDQRKQPMQHSPGSTYIPTWGQTTSRMWYVPQILETVSDMQNQTPLAAACWRLESGAVTDIPFLPLAAPGPQGMLAGYQELLQMAPAPSLWLQRAGLLRAKFCKDAAVSLPVLVLYLLGPGGRARPHDLRVKCCRICFCFWGHTIQVICKGLEMPFFCSSYFGEVVNWGSSLVDDGKIWCKWDWLHD